MELLHWIEQLTLSTWVRESTSIYAFPGILLIHTIGMGLVVGINAGIDLRILGLASELPLAPMEKFFPILWVGFAVNFVTGVLLLMADASTKVVNPDFLAKIMFIILAMINLKMIRTRVFRDPLIDKKPLGGDVRVLAFTSLIFWLGTVTTGRLMAYVGG